MAFGDLTTLADVRAYLRTGQNQLGTQDDPMLERLITAASKFIATYLENPIVQADWVQTEVSSGKGKFSFATRPVTAVESVVVDLTEIPAAADAVSAGYWFTPTQLTIQGYPVQRGAKVVFQYTAGYLTVPFDIAQACLELVVYRYKNRDHYGQTSSTLTAGGQTSGWTIRDMMPETKRALEAYKKVVPVSAAMLAPTQTDPALLVAAI